MEKEQLWVEMIHQLSRTEKAVAVRTLAKTLNLSIREVQQLIHSHEETERNYGFHLIHTLGKVQLVVDQLGLFTQLNLVETEAENENQARIDFILTALIQKNDYIRIEDLAEQLFVSRATIDRLMKQIKQTAQTYGLRILSRPKYGIALEGTEIAKRLCFAHHYAKKRNLPKDEVIVEQVQKILWQVMQKYALQINDINFYNLSYHCVIALRRIVGGNQVQPPMALKMTTSAEQEWMAAQEIVARFETEFSIRMAESEVQYIMMHLLGKRIVYNDQNISQEVWECVEEVIHRIQQVRQLDFRADSDLKTMLALHFQPMILRLKLNLPQSNPMLKQIKREMSPGYDLALCAAEILQEKFNLRMDENEAGFLALHFALALEKRKNHVSSRKIAIVCASGRGTARLIQYKMMQRYQYQEENLKLVSVFELQQLDVDHYACILSTVPLEVTLAIPVVYIDLTMNEASLKKVEPYVKNTRDPKPSQLIRESLLFVNVKMESKEEILAFLCQAAAAEALADPGLLEQVMKRERLSSTEIGNEMALPHPFEFDTEQPGFALMTLKKAVVWEKHRVRLILLLLLPKRETAQSRMLNEMAAELGTHRENIAEILACTNKEEVVACLNPLLR